MVLPFLPSSACQLSARTEAYHRTDPTALDLNMMVRHNLMEDAHVSIWTT